MLPRRIRFFCSKRDVSSNVYIPVNYGIALFLAYKLNFEYDILPLLKRYSNEEANMLPLISFAINVLNDYSTEIKNKVIYETLELTFSIIKKNEEFINALATSINNEAIKDILDCYCEEHACDFAKSCFKGMLLSEWFCLFHSRHS